MSELTGEVATRWWSLLLRGLFAVAFGVITVIVPGLTLTALILLFAAYALVEGIANIVLALRSREQPRWGS